MQSILRLPLVMFAFFVERLRQLPGARQVERRAPWVVSAFLALAIAALALYMGQRSPQRTSLPDLYAGNLAPMQTWIIITGDLRADQSAGAGYSYTLTDAAVPDARMIVMSEVELQVGRTTVSGTLVGGARRAQPGFGWIGQLRTDAVLAREPDPPWIAISLAVVALFIAFGSRTFYPVFFRQTPRLSEAKTATLPVAVRREWPPSTSQVVSATLALERGAPLELRTPTETQRLRLHSAHSSVEIGELRGLHDSEPVLVVRPATGDLTICFASTDDRDAAFAALIADTKSGSVTN